VTAISAPPEIIALVERFVQNHSAYTSGHYNETQVRREFIDPFFKALGWDMDNERGYAEAYKDIIHEDSIKVGGATKAPDYCFRVGGARKFFLEAKRPGINIGDSVDAAFQLRRYAWSSKLSLSILTDFEEFSVYDCRAKPTKTDKASTSRTFSLKYTDYLARWDEIASVFSRDAILKGSFDKYAESTKAKKGTAEVDDAFLEDIESYRLTLARNLALRNPGLTKRELNFAVQSTIDRIVFLRICEDRGIEQYGRLLALVNGSQVWARLCELFHRADERYNSGLFHFQREKGRLEPPDELTCGLLVDDKPLKDIFTSLYYPDSPYEFSVLPADILGQVYEQFLGKVIRLTDGHRAVIEDKPEVKKAGGVYYTPTYIVEYIVKQTVGKLLEGTQPGPKGSARRLRILDPACGSGSFLIAAYQYLLDWHRDQYFLGGPAKHVRELYQGAGSVWRLTTRERKRILLNSIYGVDIDPQAVETTKLSLLLKVLEGESEQTVTQQLAMFRERALPDLVNNIKCGNSLIGPDYYENRQSSFLDEEERNRVNVFAWQAEFPDVFQGDNPGFDAVIGNPPYIKEYTNCQPFRDLRGTAQFRYYQGKMDIWYVFACLAVDLLQEGGLHSFIATNNWTTSSGARILRRKLLSETRLHEFVDFGDFKVFENAGIQTMIYLVQKDRGGNTGATHYRRVVEAKRADVPGMLGGTEKASGVISFDATIDAASDGAEFTFVDEREGKVLDHIRLFGTRRLTDRDAGQGIVIPQDSVTTKHLPHLRDRSLKAGDGVFVLSGTEKVTLALSSAEEAVMKPYFTTQELGRYRTSRKNALWLIYTDARVAKNMRLYPSLRAHLDRFTPIMTSDNRPYGLHRARDERFFLGEKIMCLRKTGRPSFALVDWPCYVSQTFMILKPSDIDLKYLLGLLNSRVFQFWLDRKGKKQGDALQIDKAPLLSLPIRDIDPSNCADLARCDRMVALVQEMLTLQDRLSEANLAHEKTTIKRQIGATDQQIDRLAYELYDLTEEEIAVVERATVSP
jgi:adenine-specific DNA-methyltransferase